MIRFSVEIIESKGDGIGIFRLHPEFADTVVVVIPGSATIGNHPRKVAVDGRSGAENSPFTVVGKPESAPCITFSKELKKKPVTRCCDCLG
ncbi:hypothetical protein DSECCO2_649780 [anaerobic digester metagenome]